MRLPLPVIFFASLATVACSLVAFASCDKPPPNDPDVTGVVSSDDKIRPLRTTVDGVDYLCLVWENGPNISNRIGGMWCREESLSE